MGIEKLAETVPNALPSCIASGARSSIAENRVKGLLRLCPNSLRCRRFLFYAQVPDCLISTCSQ
ncbi:MAG: hypothetical protein IJ242_03265 [Clostridia bacterium]|nr:hypothetical protein [Clostridia bacterium]